MSRDEVAERFLAVGFQRRKKIGTTTSLLKRQPMGRKGIGKLSSFSIADVVSVHTIKNGEKTAFRMDADAIRTLVQKHPGAPHYRPQEIAHESWPVGLTEGTQITLERLRKSITGMTHTSLHRRLARRFAVIGQHHDFDVYVNGNLIEPSDRSYYQNVEYLWTYGDQSHLMPCFKNLSPNRQLLIERQSIINPNAKDPGLSVSGWIGTVRKPEDLRDTGGDNLNRLPVFMRGKLAHEDILGGFGDKRIYADYVVGELNCEDLDLDDIEDMNRHLAAIGEATPTGRHAPVIPDGAGWRKARTLAIPSSLSPLHPPPYSPGPNPMETAFGFLKKRHFANRTFETVQGIKGAVEEIRKDFAGSQTASPLSDGGAGQR